MKIFILCGGFGTRLDHQGKLMAKTMIKIGNEPILIHIIKNFSNQGFNEFVLCAGHKIETIKSFFKRKNTKIKINEKKHLSVDMVIDKKKILIDIIDTGKNTGTGGRIKKAFNKLSLDEDFLATYGDGLSNIPIKKLIKYHYDSKATLTLTAVRPKQRYGILKISKGKVNYFDNSKKKSDVYINGGFFVISKTIIKLIKNPAIYIENEPFKKIIKNNKLYSYKHHGFWASMDTLKDKNDLDHIAKNNNKLPWKVN
ncbi:sugar phosphate nucleotidyltransferase [Candidatus Pelagibacter sp.]|nr:sugar phosphate nucleotidyltransferase [Candidatus Pelagibacter sp.]